jgi:hypothetical protein
MWLLPRRKSRSAKEADKALELAVEAKEKIEARGDEVTEIANSLRNIRHDHFAERLGKIIDRDGRTDDA